MKAHFKHQRIIEGNQYLPGEHELPDEMADHWFFKGQVKEGHISIVEAPKAQELSEKPPAPELPQEGEAGESEVVTDDKSDGAAESKSSLPAAKAKRAK